MADRKTGGISGLGAKYVNEMYRELGTKVPTLKEFEKEVRSRKLPDNKKYETTPKGVKAKVDNMGTKVLKSFGMK